MFLSRVSLLMLKGSIRRMKTDHLLNRTIAGYELIKTLGRGGMGTVFLAQRPGDPQERVAIKILTLSTISTSDEFATFQARFLREAQTVHQLHHAHIVPILDYGEEESGLFYMIMPVISGGSLSHRIAARPGTIPLDKIAGYLNQLTSAVDYSNQHGMVHRDIKPGNVLLDEEENVYLADFGIVRLFDNSHLALDDAPPTLTTTGKLYGTPAYMAPERFRGEPAEPTTDLYALGILLYQLITGQVPFEADNPLALGLKHLNEEPLRPRSLRPDLPAPAEAVVLKAIAKQPAERFATASALSSAFSTGLEGKWTNELLPFATLPSEETQADLFIPPPAAAMDNSQLSSASTLVNSPAVVGREPHFWRNLQGFSLGILVIVLLLFVGLLSLAIYKLGTPTPGAPNAPGISAPATGTPTKTSVTPASTTGTAPTSGSTPSPGPGSTSTPSGGTTPTPTSPPPTPTLPLPTPTLPLPTPTGGGAP